MRKIRAWIVGQFFTIHPRQLRTITRNDAKRVAKVAEVSNAKWTEIYSGLSKWIFATLITLATGGIYLTLTLGFHPNVTNRALLLFFGAIFASMLGATSIISAISRKFAFSDLIASAQNFDDIEVSEQDFADYFKNGAGFLIALILSLVSLSLIGTAAIRLSEGMSACTAKDFESSLKIGEPVVYDLKNKRRCYFYEIEGLSNDPLIRAQQEIKLGSGPIKRIPFATII